MNEGFQRVSLRSLFGLLFFLSVLFTPTLQSSAVKTSRSRSSGRDGNRNGIEKRRATHDEENSLRSSAVKQIERGSSRLQRLYQLTQQQAQERLRQKALALDKQQQQQQQQQERQQDMQSTAAMMAQNLTPIDRSVKLVLTKAELYRISREVYEYDIAKRRERKFAKRLSRRSSRPSALSPMPHEGVTSRKNDPRYKFAEKLLIDNPEFFTQMLQPDASTGELSDRAVVTADRLRKRYMAYFGLRGGSSSSNNSKGSLKKKKKKTTKTKKKKGTKVKSKLKVNVTKTKTTKKTDKAKISVARSKKREIILPLQNMNDLQFQILTSVVYFLSQRVINKVDFKEKSMLKMGRFVFASYCLAAHFMIRYIRAEIEAADDSTLITLSSPLSALTAANPMAAMIPGMGSKTQTVKEFDTVKVNEMSQGLMFEILPAMFMHFVKKSGTPLLLVPLMGILNKMRAPLVRIHMLGQTLKRPFKSGMEEMMSALTKQVIPVAEQPTGVTSQQSTQNDTQETEEKDEIDLDKLEESNGDDDDNEDDFISLDDMDKELEKALEGVLGGSSPISGTSIASAKDSDEDEYKDVKIGVEEEDMEVDGEEEEEGGVEEQEEEEGEKEEEEV